MVEVLAAEARGAAAVEVEAEEDLVDSVAGLSAAEELAVVGENSVGAAMARNEKGTRRPVRVRQKSGEWRKNS